MKDFHKISLTIFSLLLSVLFVVPSVIFAGTGWVHNSVNGRYDYWMYGWKALNKPATYHTDLSIYITDAGHASYYNPVEIHTAIQRTGGWKFYTDSAYVKVVNGTAYGYNSPGITWQNVRGFGTAERNKTLTAYNPLRTAWVPPSYAILGKNNGSYVNVQFKNSLYYNPSYVGYNDIRIKIYN